MARLSVKQGSLARLGQNLQSDLKLDSLLYAVLNAMSEGIVLINREGKIVLANPRVDIIGLTSTPLIDQPVETLLTDTDLRLAARMGFDSAESFQALLGQIETESLSSYSLEEARGLLHIQRRLIPVRDGNSDPVGTLFVFYDLTEEHELEQSRDDLASMIVHDLRSPLTSVNSGLKLMREMIPPDSPLYETIESTAETSQRAIRKLLNRVNSLLDVSRMDRGQWLLDVEPTDLAAMTDHVYREFIPLAKELEVNLATNLHPDLPPLNVDSDKVERVLLNLVDNALKFCPSEGTVTICAHTPQITESGIPFVRVDVMDTGPGVPDEYKTKLFERFMQIKGRRGARRGIGLGLTFCRLVVQAHGGQIWIEDNPAGGSIFAFTLPLTKADASAEDDEC